MAKPKQKIQDYLRELAQTFREVGRQGDDVDPDAYLDMNELFAGDYFAVARKLTHAAKRIDKAEASVR